MNFFATLYFLCGIAYVVIGIFALLSNSKNKLNKIFFIICMNFAAWAFMFALMNRSTDAKAANTFFIYSTFCWSIGNCLLLQFIIILTGKGRLFNKPYKYFIFYLPAIFSIFLYFFQPQTTDDFVKTNLGWVVLLAKDRGFIWTNFYNLYYFTYMIAVIFFLIIWWKGSRIIREKKQARLILITLFIAVIAGGITDIILPALDIIVIPSVGIILVIIPIVGIWYSIKRYKLMDLNPENFALEVLKIMNEGLVIVDHKGIIKDINNGALKLLGYEKHQLENKLASSFLPETTDLVKIKNCNSFETEILKSNNSKLPILLSCSTLKDEWGEALGLVGIFQDI